MKKTLIIATLALIALTPAAGDAAKSKGKSGCPDDAICVWKKADYQGKRLIVKGDGVSNKIGNKINNKTSSIKNGFDKTIFIYDKRNAKGESRCLGAKDKVADLAGSYVFDDLTTSSEVPDDPGSCV